MKLSSLLVIAAIVTAPCGSYLAAQTPATAPGLWPEKPLDPTKQQFRDAVIVLRDTLRTVLATSARLDRAQASGSNAVVMSNARSLVTECERASRGAERLQGQIKGFTTSEPRGNDVLERFRRAILGLQQEMVACRSDVTTAIAPAMSPDKLVVVRTRATKAIGSYDAAVQEVMKTLSIPLDPKNHKSAIQL